LDDIDVPDVKDVIALGEAVVATIQQLFQKRSTSHHDIDTNMDDVQAENVANNDTNGQGWQQGFNPDSHGVPHVENANWTAAETDGGETVIDDEDRGEESPQAVIQYPTSSQQDGVPRAPDEEVGGVRLTTEDHFSRDLPATEAEDEGRVMILPPQEEEEGGICLAVHAERTGFIPRENSMDWTRTDVDEAIPSTEVGGFGGVPVSPPKDNGVEGVASTAMEGVMSEAMEGMASSTKEQEDGEVSVAGVVSTVEGQMEKLERKPEDDTGGVVLPRRAQTIDQEEGEKECEEKRLTSHNQLESGTSVTWSLRTTRGERYSTIIRITSLTMTINNVVVGRDARAGKGGVSRLCFRQQWLEGTQTCVF
jgi:hypothetical protein